MLRKIFAFMFILIYSIPAFGVSGQAKTQSDLSGVTKTWVATDGLGRKVATQKEAGKKKKEKYVGIFYFLFMDTSYAGRRLNDKSFIYQSSGKEGVWEALVRDGIDIWAKPYFGYYENQDEWVYRKHAQMLVAAGVDFVFLDITNPNMYQSAWKTLFRVWQGIRDEGGVTPQIVFHCGDAPERMQSHLGVLWSEIYAPGKYKNLWFMWEGKPLIFGNPKNISGEQKDFFTIKRSWAFNTWTEDDGGVDRWPWIAEWPQVPGKNKSGEIEQVAVSAGFHASTSRGRSFVQGEQISNGKKDFGYSLEETKYGLAFKEQWERALELDPKVIMVTGWNEFTNGGSEVTSNTPSWPVAGTYSTVVGDLQFGKVFVDCFSVEFSRDIEPIDGFFGDNFYYQLCHYIRLFKGMDELPLGEGSHDMGLSVDLDKWGKVQPEFRDITHDITHRNHRSVTGTYHYTNDTGRNDIEYAKVSKLDDKTYFFVSCVNDIVFDDGENWMNLFLDVDQNHETGWEGYDYIINRSRDDKYATIERFAGGGWEFEEVGKAEYKVEGNRMVICVPNNLVGLEKRDNFDFKWADNSTTEGDVMQFMDLGDAAPDSRFNFRYVKKDGNIVEKEETRASKINYGVIGALGIGVVALVAIAVVLFKMQQKGIIISAVILLVAIAAIASSLHFFGRKREPEEGGENVIEETEASKRKTITLVVREDISPDADMDKLKETLVEFIDAFKKENKGVGVRVEFVKDFPAKLSGDVVLIPADSALEYMRDPKYYGKEKGPQFADLEKHGIKGEKMVESALSLGKVGTSLQWVPFNYDRAVVLCDLNVFEELGVKVPDSNWTYEDFVETVEALTQKKNSKSYTGVYLPYHQAFVWMQFVRGFGGEWFDEDNLDLVLTQGKSFEGLSSMFMLLNRGYAQANGFDAKNSLNAKCGMSFAFASQPDRNGMYFLSEEELMRNPANYAEELAKDNNLLILPLPKFPEGDVGASNTDFIHGFAMVDSSKKKNLAAKLIGFSQSVEGQKILNKYYGGIPSNVDAQKEDFWKVGVFASQANAENALMGIEHDRRDDFFEALHDSKDLFEENIRLRAMFSRVLFRDLERLNNKGTKDRVGDAVVDALKQLERQSSITIKLAERR
jgi:ABC-type glycerol-3-phosphate transport system substrate-binding protein